MDVEKIRYALIYLVALVLSICVHEFGHAFVADKLGDPLPRSQGRVTLNPLAHIDPIGTIVMPLFAVFGGPLGAYVIGWGRPVQISLSPRGITRKVSIRTAHALIAIAGPAMNILFGLVLSGVYFFLIMAHRDTLAGGVGYVIAMNVGLCVFNLLPIPPLDGGAVWGRLLPRSLGGVLDQLNRYGFIILLALLYFGVLQVLLAPAYAATNLWLTTLYHWAAIG
jgi:Zn-dependent protease